MKINTVSRSTITTSEKFEPLIEALHKLEKGGQALQVSLDDKTELNSLESIVLEFNQEHKEEIKTSTKADTLFCYK